MYGRRLLDTAGRRAVTGQCASERGGASQKEDAAIAQGCFRSSPECKDDKSRGSLPRKIGASQVSPQ